MVSLMGYFSIAGKGLSRFVYTATLLAMTLSLFGDIFLLFDSESTNYFVFGLASFLLAHLTYGTIFLKKRTSKPPVSLFLIAVVLVMYGTLLFYYLKDSLGALTYPVINYVLAILFMAITALWRFKKVTKASFLLIFIGALFFVGSDSILSITMFKFDIPWSKIWVMGTYASAQYLIISGILRENDAIENLSNLSKN